MFGMGMPEILLILAIALIVLGPKKLPEIAKSLGRGIAEFKKATQDFKQSIEVDNDFKQAKETLQDIKKDVESTVRETVAEGAASVETDDTDDDDVHPEHTVEPEIEQANPPIQDTPTPEAAKKADTKEPSTDA
ncbi:MAG: twin-arginine translocase TatA/TatE family subunit [Deltaproteobacteria bacterium]|nr:twin-arginine translocase TatA/TatE family subunit [Deltaproteobacteria bacterium]